MSKSLAITDETVISKIYLIRGKKVMIDRDLAEMYGVETRILNQAVTRNDRRFPMTQQPHCYCRTNSSCKLQRKRLCSH